MLKTIPNPSIRRMLLAAFSSPSIRIVSIFIGAFLVLIPGAFLILGAYHILGSSVLFPMMATLIAIPTGFLSLDIMFRLLYCAPAGKNEIDSLLHNLHRTNQRQYLEAISVYRAQEMRLSRFQVAQLVESASGPES